MRCKLVGLAALSVSLVATSVGATEDPIATRKKLMDSNGASMGGAQAILKGELPFDAKVAQALLQSFDSVSFAFGDYFPPGSDKGDTRASPKIWEDMAGFQTKLAEFREDAEAGVKAKPQDVEAFKAAIGAVGENCKSCHETYRLADN